VEKNAEEIAVYERAHARMREILPKALLIEWAGRAPNDPAGDMTDDQCLAMGFALFGNQLMQHSKWPPTVPQRCGWCIRGAGDTDEARNTVEPMGYEALIAHVLVCAHNPLVAARAHGAMPAHVIDEALEVCRAASRGPARWAANRAETRETALERFTKHLDLAKEVTGSFVTHQVDLEAGDDDGGFCLAVTGNGPTSAANARFIAGAVHPEYGWEASLRTILWHQSDYLSMMEHWTERERQLKEDSMRLDDLAIALNLEDVDHESIRKEIARLRAIESEHIDRLVTADVTAMLEQNIQALGDELAEHFPIAICARAFMNDEATEKDLRATSDVTLNAAPDVRRKMLPERLRKIIGG
jgi:hypothetical protein